MALSNDALSKISREVAKFPADQKQSAVMAALAIAQDERGWLSTETIDEVASVLRMPSIAVYEVASFYAMYDTSPIGKFKLAVCTNLPCQLNGGTHAAKHLQDRLGIGFGETTSDGMFTLQEGECQGNCGEAPCLLVNNKRLLNRMSNEKLDAMLADLRSA
jgi:NADH-quinone oxidoreductase subunit E